MDYQTRPRKNSFASASMFLGVFSLLSMGTILFPIPAAALGLLFAVLARRKGQRLELPCLVGIISSTIGLVLSLTIVISSIAMIPSILKSPEYRNQLNYMSEQIYGASFDDIVEDIYGVDIDDIFED